MSFDSGVGISTEVPRSFKVAMAWIFGLAFLIICIMITCGTFNNGVVNDREALVAIQKLEDKNLNDEVVPEITNLVAGNKRIYFGGDPYNVKYQYEVNGEVHTAICTKGPAAPLMCTPFIPNNLSQ